MAIRSMMMALAVLVSSCADLFPQRALCTVEGMSRAHGTRQKCRALPAIQHCLQTGTRTNHFPVPGSDGWFVSWWEMPKVDCREFTQSRALMESLGKLGDAQGRLW